MPGHAIEREEQWKIGADISCMWDESFTLPENHLLAINDGTNPVIQAWFALGSHTPPRDQAAPALRNAVLAS